MQIILTDLPKGWGFSYALNLRKWQNTPVAKRDEFAFARQVSTVSLILSLLSFNSNK